MSIERLQNFQLKWHLSPPKNMVYLRGLQACAEIHKMFGYEIVLVSYIPLGKRNICYNQNVLEGTIFLKE